MRSNFAVQRRKSHKKILKEAKGFSARRKNCYRTAKQAVEHALLDNYIGRKLCKRDNRSLNIMRINAFCRKHNSTYSQFIHELSKKKLFISRKTIADLCLTAPEAALNLLNNVMEFKSEI